ALLLALVLAGCASAPAIDASAIVATPAAFKEGEGHWTVGAPADAQPRGEWSKAFADPVLDGLVERAGRDNASVQIAAARLAQAHVAQSYFALRALDIERNILRDTTTAYRNTLRLVERRFDAGDVAELDVARVRTELAATESEALALDARRATLEHAIAVLVG